MSNFFLLQPTCSKTRTEDDELGSFFCRYIALLEDEVLQGDAGSEFEGSEMISLHTENGWLQDFDITLSENHWTVFYMHVVT